MDHTAEALYRAYKTEVERTTGRLTIAEEWDVENYWNAGARYDVCAARIMAMRHTAAIARNSIQEWPHG